MDYLIWNEIPTVVGNLVGGLAFTGLTLYATHVRTAPKRAVAQLIARIDSFSTDQRKLPRGAPVADGPQPLTGEAHAASGRWTCRAN